jgi:hypothetical protein
MNNATVDDALISRCSLFINVLEIFSSLSCDSILASVRYGNVVF